MKRIDNRTVELTDREMRVKETFENYQRDGHGIAAAARMALNRHSMRDREFVEYLSDGTCERHAGKVRIKAEFREVSDNRALSADEMRLRLGLSS